MDMASYLFRTMASHGICVAAVEHTDGTASHTQLEDGASLDFSPSMLSREAQLKRRAAELLAAARPGALGFDDLPIGDVFLGGRAHARPTLYRLPSCMALL